MSFKLLALVVIGVAIIYPIGFAFAYHAMDTGNGHVVAAAIAYLSVINVILLLVIRRKTRR